MIARVALAALVAAIGFYCMAADFHCCWGESGFAINVAYAQWVALGLAITSALVQIGGQRRWLPAALRALTLFVLLGAIVLLARPPWNDYVVARPLHLGLRAAGVFAAAAAVAWLTLTRRRPAD